MSPEAKCDLRQIPGIGKNMERHLKDLGYASIASLRGEEPEEIYLRECLQKGCQVDRCVLYIYRLAVYYAENEERDPEKLKWWNWKD